IGDFVRTEDGTGIVHIAPSFGADDFRTASKNGLGSLTMVDLQGKFIEEMGEFAGRYVKPEYDKNFNIGTDNSVDIDIIVKLKKENKAFKVEKYEHTYPHCWRTDKPVLYYPLDSWFIKTTACKDRMIELNKTINWKPGFTGSGRFANWLENLVDWNLSRSRYWGVPLPIWTSEDKEEQICIGSVQQLFDEIEKSVKAGFMKANIYNKFKKNDLSDANYDNLDLHRPFVDEIILVSSSGKKMFREADLIDVWFDSGAMPYAQFHYPFENKDIFEKNFPADYIAEGVDQTRGWFYTLHAIAVMLFDSVAYKNCVSNGLVLDKKGEKMSKKLGNSVDPFEILKKYGADATRWYMISNSQPWDNLKFDEEGIQDAQRKFFGTLHNVYAFFALYANIDGFSYLEEEIELNNRPELDRWILSELNTLVKEVDEYYIDYEPTKAARAIEHFTDEYLSNWYVRLSRRRFWKGTYNTDKISAFQTLYTCLKIIAQLSSPIAPFFSDSLYCDLCNVTGKNFKGSVHLSDFPIPDSKYIDKDLEEKMQLAQKLSSMVLSIRKKEKIKVRQPLGRIIVPITNDCLKDKIDAVKELILTEVNVKSLEYLKEEDGIFTKKIKPDFKKLGPRCGKSMKDIATLISQFTQQDIAKIEKDGKYLLKTKNGDFDLLLNDVEIISEDIPGLKVQNYANLTVALDISITDQLREEGLARELVNRIQKIRKDKNFDVTDKIRVTLLDNKKINTAVLNNFSYICNEILATSFDISGTIKQSDNKSVIDIDDDLILELLIEKI
ncbi:MAG: isoleucine--tRNA ligase, partial [Bacteroidales bacterium]|nr:isoleucine--tRNA ligase [Bacteroidales bacterium]